MPYYMGDYRRGVGDYYMGDPGFFSFLGKVAKGVGGLLGVGGGTKTIIERTAPLAESGMGTLAKRGVSTAGGALAKIGQSRVGKMVMKHPVLSAAGAAGAIGALAGHEATKARAAAGGAGRHRRMNVCNPRALRRAIRRTHGFAKLAMRTIHLVHPKRKARFGGFRRKRKRAA